MFPDITYEHVSFCKTFFRKNPNQKWCYKKCLLEARFLLYLLPLSLNSNFLLYLLLVLLSHNVLLSFTPFFIPQFSPLSLAPVFKLQLPPLLIQH